jgi:hypothetical protein
LRTDKILIYGRNIFFHLHSPALSPILVCIQNLLTEPDAFNLDLAAKRNVRVVDNVVEARTPNSSNFQVSAFRQLLAAIDTGVTRCLPMKSCRLKM